MSPVGTHRASSTRKIGHLRDVNARLTPALDSIRTAGMAMRGPSGGKTTTGLPPSNGEDGSESRWSRVGVVRRCRLRAVFCTPTSYRGYTVTSVMSVGFPRRGGNRPDRSPTSTSDGVRPAVNALASLNIGPATANVGYVARSRCGGMALRSRGLISPSLARTIRVIVRAGSSPTVSQTQPRAQRKRSSRAASRSMTSTSSTP